MSAWMLHLKQVFEKDQIITEQELCKFEDFFSTYDCRRSLPTP